MALVIEGLSFVIFVTVVARVTEWTFAFSQSYVRAYVNAIIAGAVLSVVADFTVTYIEPGYDRSLTTVLERAASSIIFCPMVAYFALQPFRKRTP